MLVLTLLVLSVASAADAASRDLYRTTGTDNHILAYGLAPTGALFPVAGSPLAQSGSPEGVALTPDGHSLYVVSGTGNAVYRHTIDVDGSLSAAGAPRAPARRLHP